MKDERSEDWSKVCVGLLLDHLICPSATTGDREAERVGDLAVDVWIQRGGPRPSILAWAKVRCDDDVIEHVWVVRDVVSLPPLNVQQVPKLTWEVNLLKAGPVVQGDFQRDGLRRCSHTLKYDNAC